MTAPLRVFISSTAVDLAEHRKVVDETLLRLEQHSVAMERFGALPGSPVAECERIAAECDVLICIVAHRYGYEPDSGKGSITRREVEAAYRAGKAIYAWIVEDRYVIPGAEELDWQSQSRTPVGVDRANETLDAAAGLRRFKRWLRCNFVTESFTTPDDLGRKVAVAMNLVTARHARDVVAEGRLGRLAPRAELRIVHALQPAPHFRGRSSLVSELVSWIADSKSAVRVFALVAAGGTGKTAVVERVLQELQRNWQSPDGGSVLVWSMYERPDANALLRECSDLFTGSLDHGLASGQLERLQRGLRDGRSHLIILDGIERLQADGEPGWVRGELLDHSLKLLVRSIASGLGQTRAILTGRLPLVDLRDWQPQNVMVRNLDDLSSTSSREVLRGWGVTGSDHQLDVVTAQVGGHALSVAVIGSYLSSFEQGRIEGVGHFDLESVAGDDPKAARLATILAFYAKELPRAELELLSRLAVFPSGITTAILEMMVEAGGPVAGALESLNVQLSVLLERLVSRGLAFRYAAADGTPTWSAHPFVRDRFAQLLSCPASLVFDAVATRLSKGLERRPDVRPMSTALLDRYEQLIETTRLAGRVREAFLVYWLELGNYAHLGKTLGEYERAHRILRAFTSSSGVSIEFDLRLSSRKRSLGMNDLAIVALHLGRLDESADIYRAMAAAATEGEDPTAASVVLQNTCVVLTELGRLPEARDHARSSLAAARRSGDPGVVVEALAHCANVNHLLGDAKAAEQDHLIAGELNWRQPSSSFLGLAYARHLLDLAELDRCRSVVAPNLRRARLEGGRDVLPGWLGLCARVALASGQVAREYVDEVQAMAGDTGDVRWIVEAHELGCRSALLHGDLDSARLELDRGLGLARQHGFLLREIDLLIVQSEVQLLRDDALGSLALAEQALTLSSAPACGYHWGAARATSARVQALDKLGQGNQSNVGPDAIGKL